MNAIEDAIENAIKDAIGGAFKGAIGKALEDANNDVIEDAFEYASKELNVAVEAIDDAINPCIPKA